MGTIEQPSTGVDPTRSGPHCPVCGYSLIGLSPHGVCPECGSTYTEHAARRLRPWPSALQIVVGLGWPLLGILLMSILLEDPFLRTVAAYPLLIALPINSYFYVRRMLKRCLPEQRRTRGLIAALRGLGTVVCFLVLLALLLPLALAILIFIACSTR